MSTKVPSVVHPYPPVPGAPSGVGTFWPGHPFANGSSLLTGLVHYWTLNEQSGTRYDSVGTAHLTDNNTVGYAAGKSGNAASFVLANSESLSSANLQPPAEITVSLWHNPQAALANGCALVGIWTSSPATASFIINVAGSNGYQFGVSDGTTQASSTTRAATGVGSWDHLLFTKAAGTSDAYLYMNNSLVLTISGKAQLNRPASTPIRFSNNIDTFYSTCLLDDVGMWSRVLTADERATLYNAGAGKFYPNF